MARKRVAKKVKRAQREKAKAEKERAKAEAGKKEAETEEEDELEEVEGEEPSVDEEDEEEEEGEALELPEYEASPKPELDADTKRALRLRKEKKRKQPTFIRQEAHRYGRVPDKWRKPRGIHSKMRKHKGYRINVVSIGYRGPKKARGLHPSGYEEVLVHNVADIEKVDPKTQAIRIGRSVGSKKREAIEERAEELEKKGKVKYHILNPLKRYDLVAVHQPSDLEAIDRKEQAAYISDTVGKRMRAAIIAKAKEMGESKKGGVRILNVKKEHMS